MIPADYRLILQPIRPDREYFQSKAAIEKLSPTPSKESFDTLVEKSIDIRLEGNIAVEAFATHLRYVPASPKYSWPPSETGLQDHLSTLPAVALDRIFMLLPPIGRMRLGLTCRVLLTHVQRDGLWKEEGSLAAVQNLWRAFLSAEEKLNELKVAETQGLDEESRSKYPRFVPTPTLLLRAERLKIMLYLACQESLLPLFGKVDDAFQKARTLRHHPEGFETLLHRVSEHSLDYGVGYEIQDAKQKVLLVLGCFGIPRNAVPVFCNSLTKLFNNNRLSDETAKRIIYCIRQDFPDLDLTTMIPTDFFVRNNMMVPIEAVGEQ